MVIEQKQVKRLILQKFQPVIDYLMHNVGLTNLRFNKLLEYPA